MFGGQYFSASHPGAFRSENQDALLCRPDIDVYAVADGAGGHRDGRLAAETVIGSIADIPPNLPALGRLGEVRRRMATAHERLLAGRVDGQHGGGESASTAVVLLLDGRHFVCLWVGDSRIYLLRDGALLQLTRDHSLVQEMVDIGRLTQAEARHHPSANVITRAIGSGDGELQIEKRTGEMQPGDRFLLCSDGLNKTMEDDEICQVLGQEGDVAQSMLEIALRRRARDNVSVVVVRRD